MHVGVEKKRRRTNEQEWERERTRTRPMKERERVQVNTTLTTCWIHNRNRFSLTTYVICLLIEPRHKYTHSSYRTVNCLYKAHANTHAQAHMQWVRCVGTYMWIEEHMTIAFDTMCTICVQFFCAWLCVSARNLCSTWNAIVVVSLPVHFTSCLQYFIFNTIQCISCTIHNCVACTNVYPIERPR